MTAKAPALQNGSSPGISNGQDVISLQITLPQMLDLALGTPEIGAVNLNILHNFLHVLLHQINQQATKIEYRGEEANRLRAVINTSKSGPSLQLHEYSITDSSSKTSQRKRKSQTELNADVYTSSGDAQDPSKSGNEERAAASAPVTARGKNGTEKDRAGAASGAKRTQGSKQQIGAGSNGERQSVIFVEPVMNGVAPTGLAFKELEETVLKLQQRFEALDELANDPEMIERVRTSKTDPLSDMWNVINIKKRLDGCEKGIEKLTTMLQDLIKSDKIEISGGVGGSEELGRLNERIVELENQFSYLSGDVANLTSSGTAGEKETAGPSNSVKPPGSVDGETLKTATTSASEEGPSKVPSKSPTVDNESEDPSSDTKPESSKDPSASEKPQSPVSPSTDKVPEQSKDHLAGKEQSAKVIDPAGTGKSSNVKKKQPQTQERRSIIGGVDLSELKSDVNSLKSEMVNLRKNVQDLSVKVVEIVETPRPLEDPGNVKVPVMQSDISATEPESAIEAVPNIVDDASAVSSAGEKDVAASRANLPIAKPGSSKSSTKRTEPRVPGKGQADSSGRDTPFERRSNEKIFIELESRVSELEKEVGCVNEKLNIESLKALGVDGNGGIGDLVAKLQALQADMEKMNQTASRLMDEKENREFHTNALIEQIELLKTIKADKEDLEDALADKADAQAVNRKVSHDQFDATCDDLARGLEDAITKLSQQESVWQQALDDVQREIEGKLDKIEISPLKDFVNNRLKMLQEKLKTLAEMRRENEAAGTKKMLSDVQCISCDANVVMRMEADSSAVYRAPALPCSKSIKPYLTYELDQVRKQQRRLPTSRNMIQFEAAMQEMTKKSKPPKDEFFAKSPRDHLCNRYCGGSHTITTPQQRVMRMGHFLNQWGPEAIQLTEGVIRGNDGQLYRSRPMPGKPEASKASEDEGSVEIPPASRASVLERAAPQRQSQISRGRSIISQASKRLSARKTSEALKEAKAEGPSRTGPQTPPDAPPGTINDDAETMIPEPSRPTVDIVVRESSLEEDHSGEEATVTEPDD